MEQAMSRPTTAQIAARCDYVLDLETRWGIACAEGTPEADARAESLEREIRAWWAALEMDTLDKARAALYVRAEKKGALVGLEATKKALLGPVDARIRRAKESIARIDGYVLPELVRVERERVGYTDGSDGIADVKIETEVGKVWLAKPGSPALVGPMTEDGKPNAMAWPPEFTEPKPLTAKAKAYFKEHPEEMAGAGFSWSSAESIRVR
jgi:hypothetical protein